MSRNSNTVKVGAVLGKFFIGGKILAVKMEELEEKKFENGIDFGLIFYKCLGQRHLSKTVL